MNNSREYQKACEYVESYSRNHSVQGCCCCSSRGVVGPTGPQGIQGVPQCHQFKKLHKKMCSFYYGKMR